MSSADSRYPLQMARWTRWFLPVALMLLGVVWWALLPTAEGQNDQESPRPSQTRRSMARSRASATVATNARAVADPEESPTGPPVVWVKLTEMKRMDRNTITLSTFSPSRFFPSAEEVPFPDGETALAVQTMIYSEYKSRGVGASEDSRVALLLAAEAEGLLAEDLTGDIPPWTGVLALEVERTRSNAVYVAHLDTLSEEMQERFGSGPFEGTPSVMYRNSEARAFYEAHEMDRNATIQLDLALRVIDEAGPDHPASDSLACMRWKRSAICRAPPTTLKKRWT